MSLDKAILHGKEHRKPFHGAKAVDVTCRNHGDCAYCKENRTFKNKRAEEDSFKKLRDYLNGDE